ncbi:hypothetical protein GA0070607_1041 [Micromonospora coriariae]|uniref:Uncharacterized protein n=1 Tax=Micromonospora coriariae TaxID=285665 RepID=A0A1C4URW8_9ACTN|nr:hypothetical protein GA0070607_1041 [Micromonospora coriariae]
MIDSGGTVAWIVRMSCFRETQGDSMLGRADPVIKDATSA